MLTNKNDLHCPLKHRHIGSDREKIVPFFIAKTSFYSRRGGQQRANMKGPSADS
jgi:hypothetical protein